MLVLRLDDEAPDVAEFESRQPLDDAHLQRSPSRSDFPYGTAHGSLGDAERLRKCCLGHAALSDSVLCRCPKAVVGEDDSGLHGG